MPARPKRPCLHPGCAALVEHGRCAQHRATETRRYDRYARDREAKRFYDSALWHGIRERKLLRDPLCEMNLRCLAPEVATTVHHVDGDWRNNDPANHQSACASCHSSHELRLRRIPRGDVNL